MIKSAAALDKEINEGERPVDDLASVGEPVVAQWPCRISLQMVARASRSYIKIKR